MWKKPFGTGFFKVRWGYGGIHKAGAEEWGPTPVPKPDQKVLPPGVFVPIWNCPPPYFLGTHKYKQGLEMR